MLSVMLRALLLPGLAAALLSAQTPNKLTPAEAAQGWVLLFDGESLFGWTPEGGSEWKVVDGAIVAEAGQYGWLRHNAAFADFELHCEFRTAADGNSGIFLRSARTGAPHLTGYELQIFDTHPQFPTGSIVGHTPAQGAKIRPNEWQSFDVRFVGQRLEVSLDGKPVLTARDGKSAAGHVGLQFNPGKKIEFRNVRLRPLGLKPLVEGSSLTGWNKVEPPKPPQTPAEWSVKDGTIHVEKGPGQIETVSTYTNFVLQMEIRTNPKDENHHPNSGVFFRGTPKTWWSGYESQIRNEFSEGDPTKPVDFGTGAILPQPADAADRCQRRRVLHQDDRRDGT
jgi:hypothetical protein